MTYKDLEIIKNTTKVYELHFTENGQNEDITGWSIYFTCKSNMKDLDANAKIDKTVTSHSAPTDGETLITIAPADTKDLDAGNYYYSIDYKDDIGQEGIISQGKLKLIESVRKIRT